MCIRLIDVDGNMYKYTRYETDLRGGKGYSIYVHLVLFTSYRTWHWFLVWSLKYTKTKRYATKAHALTRSSIVGVYGRFRPRMQTKQEHINSFNLLSHVQCLIQLGKQIQNTKKGYYFTKEHNIPYYKIVWTLLKINITSIVNAEIIYGDWLMVDIQQ